MAIRDTAVWEPSGTSSLWRDLWQVLGCLGQVFVRPERRMLRLYELVGIRNLMTERTLYMNLGYWGDGAGTYDAACQALARLVADVAGMNRSDHVLDAGCGYGDAALDWTRLHGPARIVCLNLSRDQLTVLRRRIPAGLSPDRLVPQCGSATAIPFTDGTFSLVVAQEAAQHFITRDDFFREAHRVLAPGGRLVTAEILPREGRSTRRRPVECAEDFARTVFTAVPLANWYPPSVYEEKLRAVGFSGVDIRSIADDVYRPLLRFMSRRLDEPGVRRRANRFFRPRWMRHLVMNSSHIPRTHDYVIVRATRP